MKNADEINIKGIGSIRIRRSEKAKRLNITVKPFKGVTVSVPLGMSYSIAAQIVNDKRAWILEALENVKKIEQSNRKLFCKSGLITRSHILEYKPGNYNDISVRIRNSKVEVFHPNILTSDAPEVQFMTRKGILEAIRIEAKDFLPERIENLAARHELKYNKLTLKNIKSRWGSCSRMNNINLSIHLMTLPDHLIDYVILHELAHTVVKNHSPKFWKFLHQLTGNAKGLDKELKKHRILIY